MAEIKVKNIAKTFGGYKALSDINLTVADQEFVVLLGASGCGKTTLLRIIAGLESASEGEIWIGDRRVDHLPPKDRGIALVFQNYAIFPHLSVFENIGFGLRMKKLPETEIETRVKRTAEMMHIEQLLQRYSGEISGGQRQRVAVARALAMEPDVILMDEPLSNLDALLRLEMRAELKGILAQSKTTAIYVTHDQVEAMSLADRISVMNGGRIVQAAPPIDVYRNPANKFVAGFLGNPPMNFLPATKGEKGKWYVSEMPFDGPNTYLTNLEFAIRPEDCVLSAQGLRAMVQVIEPLGTNQLVTCNISGSMFRVILESDTALSIGQFIRLEPKKDRICWFDPTTGKSTS